MIEPGVLEIVYSAALVGLSMICSALERRIIGMLLMYFAGVFGLLAVQKGNLLQLAVDLFRMGLASLAPS